jgi:ribonuclease R
MGDDYFIHDDQQHALVGERTGVRWRLGRSVSVRLREATPITGGLLLEMLSEPEAADKGARKPRLALRGRGRPGGRTGRPPPKRR